jgi:hypothetical protein
MVADFIYFIADFIYFIFFLARCPQQISLCARDGQGRCGPLGGRRGILGAAPTFPRLELMGGWLS